ncbi:hypothetical protein [Paraburkholderia sp. ZP32-5]|uniref:hypothetical protein n=1 Tax=Paraburkholderia sp. ZP32-5 TaxID=2883245 RepID=UPI001F4273E9|nr:hypothetical protein [Paraburkholderia sp. ZP32-5]
MTISLLLFFMLLNEVLCVSEGFAMQMHNRRSACFIGSSGGLGGHAAMRSQRIDEKRTIGQKRSTRGQDGHGLPRAQCNAGRNSTDQRHPYFVIKPSSDSANPERCPT